jgi:hypothetical protein
MRKKSTDCLTNLWENSFTQINSKYASNMQTKDSSVSFKLSDLLTDNELHEKGILGRLNVFIRRI